ncbi:TRAP transporter small permease [Propionivibrio soli]|uniref:TRAP transporter small permease n=1 Tax=Propionivibrio soli TaxID=2976531 RepID=UPI0021E78317|nr:TRAP transporter small permease [Propionivibrio soli]
MTGLVDWYFRLLKFAVVVCISTMVVLVFGNVVLRYGFNSGITASEELSRWCFVWLTFIGALTALREHSHLGMDTIVSRLPVIGKKICYVLSNLIMLGCCVLFMRGAWLQTIINIDVEAPATGLSSGFFYGTGILFSGTAFLILLYDLYAMLAGKVKDSELIQVKESQEDLEEDEIRELQNEMELEMKNTKLSSDGKN